MSRCNGIDVSNNNGVVNWEALRGKITFAEIKATESLSFKDQFFLHNWLEAKKLGLIRFAYHFGHPGKDPAAQARFFTNTVRMAGLEMLDHFVLDLEVNDSLPAMHVSFWGFVFCREMNRLNPGHRILVQSDPGFIKEGNCAKLGAWHLWTMNWNVQEPEIPVGPWKSWALWQHTEGHNGGGGFDRDVFNGNTDQLREFCAHTGRQGP